MFNLTNLTNSSSITTMSSTEIAALTGKEKKSIHRDIRVQIIEGLYGIKDGTNLYHQQIQGVTNIIDSRGYVSEYHLDK
jgi:phage regulator Rha-like protein